MAKTKEEAKAYIPKETLNIADLDEFSINIVLLDGEGTDKEGKPFYYKYAEIDSKEYRVAGSVIGGVKALMEKMPNLEKVSVLKQGSGLNTTYQVIPITQ